MIAKILNVTLPKDLNELGKPLQAITDLVCGSLEKYSLVLLFALYSCYTLLSSNVYVTVTLGHQGHLHARGLIANSVISKLEAPLG